MTEEMKDAIRHMVAGSPADELERVGNLSDEDVAVELGYWSAHKVAMLNNEVAQYNARLAEAQEMLTLLTPFVDSTVQTTI